MEVCHVCPIARAAGRCQTERQKTMIIPRSLLAVLALAFFCAACERTGGPSSPTAPPSTFVAATSIAATSNAQVEAWAVATGTALRLTARAQTTPTPPTLAKKTPAATMAPEITALPPTVAATVVPVKSTSIQLPLPSTDTAVPEAPTSTQPAPPPTDSVAPSATPLGAECYTQRCARDFVSPDGQNRWPETCDPTNGDPSCYITFANGQVTASSAWRKIWSADGQFLLAPEGGSQRTTARGFEIWNMSSGTRTARIDYNYGREWWSPTSHTLAYVKMLPGGVQEFHLLDAAAGDDQTTRQCAKWATDQLSNDDFFDWHTLCDNWTPAANRPAIITFTVSPTEVNPGDPVTLSWTSSGGTSATLSPNLADRSPHPIAVPVNGTLVITVPTTDRLDDYFVLRVTDDTGKSNSLTRRIDVRCPDAFFFTGAPPPASAGCPYKPAVFVDAIEQPFEHGRMIWLAPAPDAQSAPGTTPMPSVYVLFDPGTLDAWTVWRHYYDTWTPQDPETDYTLQAPDGFLQPKRGIGKVWHDNPEVRDNLKWATGPEKSFAGAYQLKWAIGAYLGDFYLCTADGSILKMTLSGYAEKWQP
jgi:hypothetical protein